MWRGKGRLVVGGRKAAIALSLLAAGCAGLRTQVPPGVEILSAISARVEYIDEHNDPVPARYNPRELLLEFPVVAGGLFGAPVGPPVLALHVEEPLEIALDLDAIRERVRAAARPLRESPATTGLVVKPAGTRLARIGTFAWHPGRTGQIGAGGFIDVRSRDFLILLYVDAPCMVTGVVALNGQEYMHDIRLPGAGFHWVRVQSDGPARSRLRRHLPADGVLFSVTLLHLQPV